MSEAFGKARRLAGVLNYAVLAAMAAIGSGVVYVAIRGMADPLWLAANTSPQQPLPLAVPADSGLAIALAAHVAIFGGLAIYALNALRQAFRSIARSRSLSLQSAILTRRAGMAFLVNAIALMIAPTLLSLIFSAFMPAGSRFITVGLSSAQILALVTSGALAVFGHLTAEAAALDEEMRQIV